MSQHGCLQEEVLEGSGIVAQPTALRGKRATPLARAMLKVSQSVRGTNTIHFLVDFLVWPVRCCTVG